jgi:hypothetical protein
MPFYFHKTTISSESATFSRALPNILNPLSEASGFWERVFYGRCTEASPESSGTSGDVRKLPQSPAELPEMYGSFPTVQRTFRRCTEDSPESSKPSGGVRKVPRSPAKLPEEYRRLPRVQRSFRRCTVIKNNYFSQSLYFF